MQNEPLVSFLMSVYNGEQFLEKSIEAIEKQTYKNFEAIIINDGSTDKTKEKLNALSDIRFKIIHNETNLGLTKSLNIGLKQAKGIWVARTDVDDCNDEERLEKQIQYAEHNDLDVCFTDWTMTEPDGKKFTHYDSERTIEQIRWLSLFRNSFGAHPTALFKREKILNLGGYNEKFRTSQDYELWNRCFQNQYKLGTCPAILVQRTNPLTSISTQHKETQSQNSIKVSSENIRHYLSSISDDDIYKLRWLLRGESTPHANISMKSGLKLIPKLVDTYLVNNPETQSHKIWTYIGRSLHWRIHKLKTFSDRVIALRLFCLAVVRSRGNYFSNFSQSNISQMD